MLYSSTGKPYKRRHFEEYPECSFPYLPENWSDNLNSVVLRLKDATWLLHRFTHLKSRLTPFIYLFRLRFHPIRGYQTPACLLQMRCMFLQEFALFRVTWNRAVCDPQSFSEWWRVFKHFSVTIFKVCTCVTAIVLLVFENQFRT